LPEKLFVSKTSQQAEGFYRILLSYINNVTKFI